MTFEHRLKCQERAAHTKSGEDHGSSPQEPPSLVEEKRCTNTRDTSHLTYLNHILPDAGGGRWWGRGEGGQQSDYVGLNTGQGEEFEFHPKCHRKASKGFTQGDDVI